MLQEKIRAHLDQAHAIALLQNAIRVPSVTGTEAAFAQFVAKELNDVGASQVSTEEFAPGRANAWGVMQGGGGGKNLMFLGHLDTVHVRGWAEHWAGTERENPFSAAILDGEIWGRGAADLKGGICTVLAALRTLKSANIPLRGDVVCVFCGDEESGEEGSGVSAGIKAIVPKVEAGLIPSADFAVYVEPTRLQVFTAQMGFFVADITVTGKSAYFGVPEQGVDALKAGYEILTGLWQHNDAIGRLPPHPLVGKAFLLVTAIQGGGYIAVPEKCTLSLIRKVLPGEDLEQARAALELAIRGAVSDVRISVDIAYPAARDHAIGGTPCETDNLLDGVHLLSQAAAQSMAGKGLIEGAPYWSEAPFTTMLGIPTVYCAPGDIADCHTMNERIPIAEYLAAIEAFALMMVHYCGASERP